MAQAAEALPQSGTQTPADYPDGAQAEAAFQSLVDRGLFSDTPPANPAAKSVAAVKPDSTVAQPQSSPAAPEPVGASPPETEPYASLDEFLTKSSLDRDSFLELPVTVKVDGAESAVPLSKLLKSYQTDASVTHRSEALAEQRKAFEGEAAQARTQLQQQLQASQALWSLAQQNLNSEFQNVNWNQLRQDNPAEWSALRQQFVERQASINQYLAQTQAGLQQTQNANLEVERTKMLEALPEWRDPEKFRAGREAIASYATSRGFTPAEMNAVLDHRYMLVLSDAARTKVLQAEVDTLKAQLAGKTQAALKLVRSAPPMAAPGARISRDPKAARLEQVRQAANSGRLARDEVAQLAAFSALADAGA